MKTHCIFLLLICAISGCKAGFELEDENSENSDNINGFKGPTMGLSWELDLNDNGSFTLSKRNAPSNSTEYQVLGSYQRLDSGFTALEISTSPRPSAINTQTLTALEFDQRGIFIFPFEDTNPQDILALVSENDCPSNDFNGAWFYMENNADANSATNDFMGSFVFSTSANLARLSDRAALTNDFPTLNEVSLDEINCENGFDELDSGDQYIASDAAVIEQTSGDNYRRLMALPSLNVTLNAINADYIGFKRTYSEQLADITLISAACTDGVCTLSERSDTSVSAILTNRYTINFDEDSLNSVANGFVSGILTEIATNNIGNILCNANTNLTSANTETTKTLVCNAQSPANTSGRIQFVLRSDN